METIIQEIDGSYEMIEMKMIASLNMTEMPPSKIYKTEMTTLLKKVMPKLLHDFWQSKSDACPLEVTQMEQQEADFEKWVLDQFNPTPLTH